MCFGCQPPRSPELPYESAPANAELGGTGSAVYGRVFDFPSSATPGRRTWTVLRNWSVNGVDCSIHELNPDQSLDLRAGQGRESILIVEQGTGGLLAGAEATRLDALDALRAGPDAIGSIRAETPMRIMEVSMACLGTPPERRSQIEHRRGDGGSWKQYEYEALGQEVFTPDYEGAIGLLRFIFPQDEIPMHVHPRSGRIIRPISGRGYTYMHPQRHPMDNGTIAAFDANVIHTNGPLRGQNYELWAIQLPWVASGIDTENVAGFESFVRYVAEVPTQTSRKSRSGLIELARHQGAKI